MTKLNLLKEENLFKRKLVSSCPLKFQKCPHEKTNFSKLAGFLRSRKIRQLTNNQAWFLTDGFSREKELKKNKIFSNEKKILFEVVYLARNRNWTGFKENSKVETLTLWLENVPIDLKILKHDKPIKIKKV